MRGSIRKRGTAYQYRFHITDPETGKRKEISKGGFKTKKEASAALAQAMADVETNGYIKPTTVKLIEFYNEYVSTRVQGNLRPNSVRQYLAVQKHIDRTIGHIELDKLNALHLNQFIKDLKDCGYQNISIRTYLSKLKVVLKAAYEWKIIKQDFSSILKHPLTKKKMEYWTFEECMEFLEKAKYDPYYLVYLLTIFTGLRRGEVLGISESSLDFTRNTIIIEQQFIHGTPPALEKILKTQSSNRVIEVPADIMLKLKKHIIEQKKQLLKLGIQNEHQLIFLRPDGHVLSPTPLSYHFKQSCIKHGVRRIKFHGLRHSHATMLAEMNESAHVIADRLGHSTVSITNEVYIHLTKKMKSSAISKLNTLYEQTTQSK
ncbi:tyrosine-type recombinase/integrase [Bacillus songklensis]|uniref:Tyrosine-type recombinase/integrase n=1 Tax=Bacillus songklensis TaxID=1069116 RepID=A0ABV8B733_9BACI